MTDAGAHLLQTIALSKSFGGLAAVRDVSLSLARAELHAVIGPNGAGKSTLVNLLSGALQPTAGRIVLDGEDVTRLPEHARTHLGLARSFQRTNILGSLTVLENVRLAVQAVTLAPRRLLARPEGEPKLLARAKAALERAGLPYGQGRIAGTLAHGQQRQLEIAMALAAAPKVLLLDEPLAGTGAEEAERLIALLRGLKQRFGILLIEHDMPAVFALADRISVLAQGKVIASGTPDAIRADAQVRAAYLGDDE